MRSTSRGEQHLSGSEPRLFCTKCFETLWTQKFVFDSAAGEIEMPW